MVREVEKIEEFHEAIGTGKLVIIDFWASWCGPCLRFGPQFDALSKKHTDVVFLKVNADNTSMNELINNICNVRALPTLCFFCGKAKPFQTVVGPNSNKIEEIIVAYRKVRDEAAAKYPKQEPDN